MTIYRLARWGGPLLVLPFMAVVSAALARTVSDEADVPLAPLTRTAPGPELTPIAALTSQSGQITRRIEFIVSDRPALAAADQLRLAIDGYAHPSRMLDAHFDVDGTGCSYRAPSRTLDFDTVLTLTRGAGCTVAPGAGRAALTIVLAGQSPWAERVGLVAMPMLAGDTPLLATVDTPRLIPVGNATHRRSAARIRVSALLAWMWNVTERTVWLFVAAGALLVITGAALATSRGAAVAVAAFCLASGIALLYVIAVPPLQAPDETDHLLSFAQLTGRTDLPAAEAAWAKRVHFDRIAFRHEERFTPADRDTPWYRAWNPTDVFAEDVAHRSSAATRFWRLLSLEVPTNPAHALLGMRSADAAVFGLAFGTAMVVMTSAGAAVPGALTLLLLSVPALPFFAMQLSEITWSIAAFVVIAAGCSSLLTDHDNIPAGAAFGVALPILAAGTRAGWPMAATIAAAAVARVVARSPERRGTPWFWIAFVVPTLVLFGSGLLHVPTPAYDQWHLPLSSARISFNSAAFIAAVAFGGALGYVCDVAWPWIARAGRLTLRRCWIVPGTLAVCIGGTLVLSLFVQLPQMPTLETASEMPLPEYIRRVLLCILTVPRAAGADFFAWTTFLSGFGWLDTFLPERLISAITATGGAIAIWWMTSIAIARDGRRGAIVGIMIAGTLVSVVGCAIGAFALNRTLHGRYLIGPYLAAIAVLCAGPAILPPRRVPASVRTFALLTVVLGVHAAALWVIANRYFW